jgi:tetratricopeptide (TPR) repeat protein
MRLNSFALTLCLGLLAAQSALAADDDTIRLKPNGNAVGTISKMSATDVSIDMAGGQKRTIPVNEIETIIYADEPAEMRQVRSHIGNGNYENAINALEKIAQTNIAREEVKLDVAYYTAYCRSRIALAGGGDVGKAGGLMRQFVAKSATNYHHLQAAEILGDLFAAVGRFDLAYEQYSVVEKAPWPDYKLRAGVAKGRVLAAQKKYPEALVAFEAVIKLAGDSPGAAAQQKLAAELGKAICLANTDKVDEGIKLVQQVIEASSPEDNDLNGRAYLALGNCYKQKAGAAKDARDAFLHVDLLYFQNREVHAEALHNLVRLFSEVGPQERSLQASQILKERYPGSVWAKN